MLIKIQYSVVSQLKQLKIKQNDILKNKVKDFIKITKLVGFVCKTCLVQELKLTIVCLFAIVKVRVCFSHFRTHYRTTQTNTHSRL